MVILAKTFCPFVCLIPRHRHFARLSKHVAIAGLNDLGFDIAGIFILNFGERWVNLVERHKNKAIGIKLRVCFRLK